MIIIWHVKYLRLRPSRSNKIKQTNKSTCFRWFLHSQVLDCEPGASPGLVQDLLHALQADHALVIASEQVIK